ncbi:MAG: flagellar hook-basal body complex protein FliE [Rhizobiales bacterium]|nr:flagellar hook-basal body complex protein FliE [Hyphomicrobiales bacterium]
MIASVGLVGTNFATGGTGLGKAAFGGASEADSSAGTSFGDLLAAAAGKTVDSLRNAEQAAVKGMQGGADTREVVDAVMSAEQSLQAAIAIRDKIVTAYLDISRMAI